MQVPLTRQQLGDLYIMREVVNTTSGWRAEEAKCDPTGRLGSAWASVWAGPEHVFFGHDHQRGLQARFCNPLEPASASGYSHNDGQACMLFASLRGCRPVSGVHSCPRWGPPYVLCHT